MSNTNNTSNTDFNNKVVSLYNYIKELKSLNQSKITHISNHLWYKMLSELHEDDENIKIYYRDESDLNESNNSDNDILFSIHKPEYERCPEPDKKILPWLKDGWDSYEKEVAVNEKIPIYTPIDNITVIEDSYDYTEEENVIYEYFDDDASRVQAYEDWLLDRNLWVERQKTIKNTQDLFSELYDNYFMLKREGEVYEVVIADGIFIAKNNHNIKHPVLTKRVKIDYDPEINTIYIVDINSIPELYTTMFQEISGINTEAINAAQKELQKKSTNPFDHDESVSFLNYFSNMLSSESKFYDRDTIKDIDENQFSLYIDPCFIIRKRNDGAVKAIERILETIDKTGYIPAPILDIVNGGKLSVPEYKEETLAEQLAAVGGESIDILLAKEANREQLDIAKRIENYNAVIVQGPPGTGKTHTIANLIGHFLAQGKTVLITSEASKALKVLKEKLPQGIQNLCVSVLDDSNEDMEHSVDGIIKYMSKANSKRLYDEMLDLKSQRMQVIKDLEKVRTDIFYIINKEYESIVYNGESITPTEAAKFVFEHREDLSYIPGKIMSEGPLPLSLEELYELYSTNFQITAEDEAELEADLPNPDEILSVDEFEKICKKITSSKEFFNELSSSKCRVDNNYGTGEICFEIEDQKFSTVSPNENQRDDIEKLKSFLKKIEDIPYWKIVIAIDGKNGEVTSKKWHELISRIKETREYSIDVKNKIIGRDIYIDESCDNSYLRDAVQKLKLNLKDNGKLRFAAHFNKDISYALEHIRIDGNQLKSAGDCDIVLDLLELKSLRKQCALYWNKLLSECGLKRFEELDNNEPEIIAYNMVKEIEGYLSWYYKEFVPIISICASLGIMLEEFADLDILDSDSIKLQKILRAAAKILPIMCEALLFVIDENESNYILKNVSTRLKNKNRINSEICNELINAISLRNTIKYADAFNKLRNMYGKYVILKKRNALIDTISLVAPQWAESIKNREGIHGSRYCPDTIIDAWKWKILYNIIDRINSVSFVDLQKRSKSLSEEYRKITAKYAEKCAWYHLLRKTEGNRDIQQALNGWEQTVRKIGKGYGKNVSMYRAKARELMGKCQEAVPAWIMPINMVLESLNPAKNKFDVVIVDEASQSGITAMAILYFGKKFIIVGDDKQVSPEEVGISTESINALQEMYLKDKGIANDHLYDKQSSIYDIAKTTFSPLMLREHFRCVPDIIGFSNELSYDHEILPLREASSSNLLPAVVSYRVQGVKSENNTNIEEAEAIVALIQACIKQEEYANKSFGIITLLGYEQANLIQHLIEQKIPPKEVVARHIMCGTASQFQGDERDVIFISMIYSNEDKGPLKLISNGQSDNNRKKYNVAASRAKDQLWVVHSLDPGKDLKPGDLRKRLIDYANNPKGMDIKIDKIKTKAESPFEVAVAVALTENGYKIVQQFQAGAYRIDMVVINGDRRVAIECDGALYHSSERQIRNDMERQTILERTGWKFIRIRGSEYYRNPDSVIKRVISELNEMGIYPEYNTEDMPVQNKSELLERVKLCAGQIIAGKNKNKPVSLSDINEDSSDSADDKNMKSIETQVKKTSRKTDKTKNVSDKSSSLEEQLSIVDYLEETFDIIAELDMNGIEYVDKRKNRGGLWIIGGSELKEFIDRCNNFGYDFVFKKGGGKSTEGKDAWYTKKR